MEPIKIQKVIDYIENNLTEELSYEFIAEMLAVSESDLQRSFKMITGLTISDYVRNRRLTNAALAIKNDNMKVLDAAILYGYQTAESFSKAFRQYHGCTPIEAKKMEQTVRYFQPIIIKLAKRGGSITEYEAYHDNANSIMAYYDASNEHDRLTKNKHASIEYLVTMKYLDDVLPKGGHILDCCAGAGAYAFELAKKHQVTATDLSEKNVHVMKELQRERQSLHKIDQMDVLDMSCFEDESFDAVLCMGALYHLFDESLRRKAIQECKRVCKKDGVLVFSYLNKWGSFYNGMINNLKPMELLYKEYESSNHENIFYRSSPNEMEDYCQQENLNCIYNIGVDHLSYLNSEKIDMMNDEEFEELLKYQFKASEELCLVGTSLHGLWIGKRK